MRFFLLAVCLAIPAFAQQCSFSLSPPAASFTASGGTGIISITATDSSCSRPATSSVDWISIPVGPVGTGNGRSATRFSPMRLLCNGPELQRRRTDLYGQSSRRELHVRIDAIFSLDLRFGFIRIVRSEQSMRLEREHKFAMDQRFCHSKLRDRPRELDCICQHRNSVENGRDIDWDLEFHHHPARVSVSFRSRYHSSVSRAKAEPAPSPSRRATMRAADQHRLAFRGSPC